MPGVVRDRGLGVPLAAGLAGLVVVAALLALRVGGQVSFGTDPVGAMALACAIFAAALAGSKLAAAGATQAAGWARWLAFAVLVYLGSALWAVGAHALDYRSSALAVALWSAAWLPPLALGQLTASAAIRAGGPHRPWPHLVLLAVLGLAVATNLLLVAPSAPFTGVPTIAPESWHTQLAPLGLAVTGLAALGFVLLPVLLWRAALTSESAARARLGVAAAGASTAPLAIAFCLLLAAARTPGGVEPSLGSVAFLVALASATVVSSACAALASRGAVQPRHLWVVVRGTGLASAGLLVLGLGTMVAAPNLGLGATAIALIIATSTVAIMGTAWFATGFLIRALLPASDAVAAASLQVPRLTRRESEVLALVAEGASNAGIAQQLVVSKRTVDAHLRAIFVKLDLGGAGPETNRRVQAAPIWFDVAGRREIGGTADADR